MIQIGRAKSHVRIASFHTGRTLQLSNLYKILLFFAYSPNTKYNYWQFLQGVIASFYCRYYVVSKKSGWFPMGVACGFTNSEPNAYCIGEKCVVSDYIQMLLVNRKYK